MPSPPDPAPRVAVTLTQCWHRVPGGYATSVLGMVDALVELGGVDVVGVGPRGGDAHEGFRPSVAVERLSIPLPFLYDAWDRFRRPTVESAAGPVDVVHLTVPMSPPRTASPLIATVHDIYPLVRPEWFTRRGVRLMRRGLERIRAEAAAVVVPSLVVAADCEAQGFSSDRLHVVPLGTAKVDVSDDQVRDAMGRHGLRDPYVLFVGTLEPRKGLAVLAEAMVELGRPDVTLVLAGPQGWGDGDPAGLSSVPGPVARLGFLPATDLAALQRGAAAFCYPSWAEGFGLPVLEAMAAGAPVVTTEGTATGEVAGDAALLVPPGSPGPLAESIASVLDDPDLADHLRVAGRARAAGYTWESVARAMSDIYRQVLR